MQEEKERRAETYTPPKKDSKHIKILRNLDRATNEILHKKGLNSDFKDILFYEKHEKIKHRGFGKTKKILIKDKVLDEVLKSKQNETYLLTLKKKRNELEESLKKMGLDLNHYKGLA